MRLSFVLIFFLFTSCGLKKDEKSELVFFERSPEFFNQFVNQENTPGQVDVGSSKVLSTRGLYDIDLVLFKDGQFYYSIPDLPNEKDGYGSWEYASGQLVLNTSHTYPVVGEKKVEYKVIAVTPDSNGLRVKFRDRTGEQSLDIIPH